MILVIQGIRSPAALHTEMQPNHSFISPMCLVPGGVAALASHGGPAEHTGSER